MVESRAAAERWYSHGFEVLKSSVQTTLMLFKILIPVSIIVKVLAEFDVIPVIGRLLAPVMGVVGLPGETGLVWATAMVTNLYGSILVFFTLSLTQSFSVAEVTILAALLLVAHTLPIELRIAHKAGVSLVFTFVFRVVAAFLLAWLLHVVFSGFDLFGEANVMLWQPADVDPTIVGWVLSEVQNYLMIFVIITVLVLLMYVLRQTGVIDRLNMWLEPLLRILGMSKEAAPLTIIGTTLGLSYGGALIIKEAKSGRLSDKDVFLSISLMGLSHSLIEDTLIMVAIGASLVGVLFGRIIFTLLVMLLLVRVINKISSKIFHKVFMSRIKI